MPTPPDEQLRAVTEWLADYIFFGGMARLSHESRTIAVGVLGIGVASVLGCRMRYTVGFLIMGFV